MRNPFKPSWMVLAALLITAGLYVCATRPQAQRV